MSSVVSFALITMPLGSVMFRSATWWKPRSTANVACAEIGSLLKYFRSFSSFSAAYSRTACEASMCRNVVESCIDASFPFGAIAYRSSVRTGALPGPLLPFFPSRDNKRDRRVGLENLPAFRRRMDAKLLTILGPRPTRYLYFLVLEQLDDPRIGVRILRTPRADDLLDLELDRL